MDVGLRNFEGIVHLTLPLRTLLLKDVRLSGMPSKRLALAALGQLEALLRARMGLLLRHEAEQSSYAWAAAWVGASADAPFWSAAGAASSVDWAASFFFTGPSSIVMLRPSWL